MLRAGARNNNLSSASKPIRQHIQTNKTMCSHKVNCYVCVYVSTTLGPFAEQTVKKAQSKMTQLV